MICWHFLAYARHNLLHLSRTILLETPLSRLACLTLDDMSTVQLHQWLATNLLKLQARDRRTSEIFGRHDVNCDLQAAACVTSSWFVWSASRLHRYELYLKAGGSA